MCLFIKLLKKLNYTFFRSFEYGQVPIYSFLFSHSIVAYTVTQAMGVTNSVMYSLWRPSIRKVYMTCANTLLQDFSDSLLVSLNSF